MESIWFEDHNGAVRDRPEYCVAFGGPLGQPAAVHVGRIRYVPEPGAQMDLAEVVGHRVRAPDTIPCGDCTEFVHVATIAALLRFPDGYVGETCPRCGLRVARAALLEPVDAPEKD